MEVLKMIKKELQTIKKAIQKKELKYYILGRLLRIIILMLFTGLITWMFYEYLFTFNHTW